MWLLGQKCNSLYNLSLHVVYSIYYFLGSSKYARSFLLGLFIMVHGKTTDKWHTNDIQVHMSDLWMTYEYIRVIYGWHTSTYEWHTNDMRVHTSDIRMTYEYIRVIYGWHTSTYGRHTITYKNIRVTYRWHTSTYDWHTNDIRVHISKIKAHANDMPMTCEWQKY